VKDVFKEMRVTDGQLIVTIDGAWQMTNARQYCNCDEISVTWIQKVFRNGARNGVQTNRVQQNIEH